MQWQSKDGSRPVPSRFCPSIDSLETDPKLLATENERWSLEMLMALLSSKDLVVARAVQAQDKRTKKIAKLSLYNSILTANL
jgi:hypothetical protein